MSMSLRQALSLAVGPRNVDAAGHAIADWLESRHGVMASLVRTEVTKDRPAGLDQDVPHDRPDTSVRAELMAKLATQREVILDLCKRVDRLEMRADGLTPIERVERRWAREAAGPAAVAEEPAPPAEGEVGEGPSDEAEANFTAWFCRNYPIIHRPELHAPKVFRTAAYALARWNRPAAPPAGEVQP